MKKHLLLIICTLWGFSLFAQTFTNTIGGAITDNNQYCYYPLIVSGLPNSIDSISFGLEYISLNINHPSDKQLQIKLQTPDGSLYDLSTFNGGTGANYTNTIFHNTSTIPVASGIAPFTGIYKPENSIVSVNNHQNPNGTWNLMVLDQTTGLSGNVVSWRLTFSNTPAGYAGFSATNLPIIILNTNGVAIPNSPKIDGNMGIIYNGPGMMNHPTDSIHDYNGKIGIEIRGASSAGYPQAPYALETRDTNNVQADASILSMPAEHDWSLISNWNDKVFIRNTLAYHLFRKMGHYAPRTRLAEVIVNGSYEGIYVLSEKIKCDSNRVSIAHLDSAENTGLNVTGGYILQNNLWGGGPDGWQLQHQPIDHPNLSTHLLYEYPKAKNITNPQKSYIQTFINDFETALYSANFQDSVMGYRKYIGMNSFVDYLIVNELSRNGDGFKKSQFYFKGKDSTGYISPLKAGPVWDFDWAWKDINECSIFAATDGSGWSYKVNDCGPDNNSTGWMVRMMDDTIFQNKFRCRWDHFRTTIISDSALYGYIDSMTLYLNAAQARHFQKWATLGYNNGTPEIEQDPGTYLGEVQAFKDWISRRLAWLDSNIPGNPNCPSPSVVTGNTKTEENYFITMYPNPANESVKIQFTHANKLPKTITITDITGKILIQEKINNGENTINISALKNGLYFCKITDKNAVLKTEKLLVMH